MEFTEIDSYENDMMPYDIQLTITENYDDIEILFIKRGTMWDDWSKKKGMSFATLRRILDLAYAYKGPSAYALIETDNYTILCIYY